MAGRERPWQKGLAHCRGSDGASSFLLLARGLQTQAKVWQGVCLASPAMSPHLLPAARRLISVLEACLPYLPD